MQSGPCLIQLLQNDLRPILRKEDGNRDAMYLYSLGTWWVAFEGSAFQLSLRCPGANVLPFRLKDVPYPVLAACVAADDLPGCNPRKECLTLRAPSLDTKKYRQWRAGKLKWFLEDLKHTPPPPRSTDSPSRDSGPGVPRPVHGESDASVPGPA